MSRPTIDAASAVRIVREEFGVVRRLRAARPSVAAQTPLVSLQLRCQCTTPAAMAVAVTFGHITGTQACHPSRSAKPSPSPALDAHAHGAGVLAGHRRVRRAAAELR